MAKFNEILVGRFNRALQKLLSMKGGPPSAQLATEITPNIQFNSMGNDFRALEDWYRFGIIANIGPVAAAQSGVRFRNPTNSNRIAVFEKISAGNGSAAAVFTQIILETQTTNVDLAGAIAINANVSWDKRKNVGSGLILSQAAPAAALSLGRAGVDSAINTTFDFILTDNAEVILSPGEAIQLRMTANNQELDTTWWWRERFFEESEATA
jgi:hypothetical protein